MSRFLPSPSLGDGSGTGPTALWIENFEKAAVVVVVFIYNGTEERRLQVQTESGLNISR